MLHSNAKNSCLSDTPIALLFGGGILDVRWVASRNGENNQGKGGKEGKGKHWTCDVGRYRFFQCLRLIRLQLSLTYKEDQGEGALYMYQLCGEYSAFRNAH